MSARFTEKGVFPPMAKSTSGPKESAPLRLVLGSTETFLRLGLVTTRSGLPSPLRSPTVTVKACPALKSTSGAKASDPAVVVFSSTDTTPAICLETMISGKPAVEIGNGHGTRVSSSDEVRLAGEGECARRRRVQEYRHASGAEVGGDDVRPAVAIEVGDRD